MCIFFLPFYGPSPSLRPISIYSDLVPNAKSCLIGSGSVFVSIGSASDSNEHHKLGVKKNSCHVNGSALMKGKKSVTGSEGGDSTPLFM